MLVLLIISQLADLLDPHLFFWQIFQVVAQGECRPLYRVWGTVGFDLVHQISGREQFHFHGLTILDIIISRCRFHGGFHRISFQLLRLLSLTLYTVYRDTLIISITFRTEYPTNFSPQNVAILTIAAPTFCLPYRLIPWIGSCGTSFVENRSARNFMPPNWQAYWNLSLKSLNLCSALLIKHASPIWGNAPS